MSLIVLLIVVIVVVALLCFAVDKVPQIAPYSGLIQALIIVGGVVVIVQQSGLLRA